MRCYNCGAEIVNGAQFCQVCGATQPAQSTQQFQQPIQPGYQQPLQQGYMQQGHTQTPVSMEDISVMFKIICLLVPIAGFVYWLVKKNTEPVAAKSCLMWAAIGVGLNILLALF